MSAAAILIPVLLIFLIFVLLIPIAIGVYVYRDANRRGMNALLWALVAALVPSLIGLIIYLLVRGNYSDLHCPRCETPVTDRFVVCPKCGAKLRPSCPNCSSPVEPDWRLCPHCAQPLPEVQNDVQVPVRAKDRSIWKILVIVILVPILLIALLVLGFCAFSFAGGSSSFQETTFMEYEKEMDTAAEKAIATEVMEWLDEIRPAMTLNQAYALRYDHETDTGHEYYFAVYVPGTSSSHTHSFGQSGSIFGTTLTLELNWTGNDSGFFHVVSSADKAPKLKIKVDGKNIPCTVTEVDYNPTVYYIVPRYDEPEPGSADFFMPERISVVKIDDNVNVGVYEVEHEDLSLNILVGIDSAPYLELEHDIYGNPDGTGGYDFKDGFEIIIEYEVHEDLVLHEDMLRCLALEQNGTYYLIDDRPDNGRTIREIDKEFYEQLEALFP